MHSTSAFEHVWMPFSWYQDMADFPPRIITRGSGIHVFDTEGRSYIDAVGSWWVSSFGHNHPAISAAIKKQLDSLEHILMAGFISEPALRLSHLLAGLLPSPLSRIFYSDDGSTAVEVALKIALQYHALRKSKAREFVALDGSYHGDTLGAMSVSNIPAYHTLFHERFKKQHAADSPYCYRCAAGKDPATCGAECMVSLERLLEMRRGNIAACIFEPMVQGAAGMRVYPAKVLKRIFEICRHYKVLTIADEVATGFGRTGKLFACEHGGEIPDIICLAKGLTGGYVPMGVTAVTDRIFEEFKGGFGSGRILHHGHSFTGNPLAAAAACASMELIGSHSIPASLEPLISRFSAGLERFRGHRVVGDIRSIGMIGALEFVKDRRTREPFPAERRFAFTIAQKALDHGLLVRPLGDVIYFIPAFIITTDQIDDMFSRLHRAIEEVGDAASAD
jgi:adenosylmethionine---8-amino-7-oxononanoate aminotransferase